MKTLLIPASVLFLFACNNAKKESTTNNSTENNSTATVENTTNTTKGEPGSTTVLTIDGKEMQMGGSILVTKDKSNLHPGAKHDVTFTAGDGPNGEGVVLEFLMDTKPGVYPIVGQMVNRGSGDNGEVYGTMIGAKTELTGNSVNITEVKDLGKNATGGHKWSISGNFSNLVIPAMSLMLLDESKKHPKEIRIDKGSFANLTFDDDWAEQMEKAVEKLKEANK
jgi:hypothetical protein